MSMNSSPTLTEPSSATASQSSINSAHLLGASVPTRKQNVACDACRSRKVKCHQLPGQEKCQHCIAKNFDCTHHIQQATSEKRRVVGNRRPKLSAPDFSTPLHGAYPSLTAASRPTAPSQPDINPLVPHTPTQPEPPYGATRKRTNPTLQLVDWLFSPPDDPIGIPPFVGGGDAVGYRNFAIKSKIPVLQHTNVDWGDLKRWLQGDDFRTELANDLVEVYFQICHSRMPLLNPAEFRTRLTAYLRPTAVLDPSILPLPHALLATVIAWGAKFSEHPVLVHDRDMNGGRSRICCVLTRKAREVAEAEKIHRLPTIDNAIIALLLDPLHSHNPSDPDGFRGFWLNCSVRHLFELGMNRRDRLLELGQEQRSKMSYAWWMACLADAYAAVYWRKKPVIEEDDYDIDFIEALDLLPKDAAAVPKEALNAWVASLAMADIARKLARQLSRPSIASRGMPCTVLTEAMDALHCWKDKYLSTVGVPNNFQADWDFIAAVSACTSDANYHVMWVILHSALEEFQLQEAKTGELEASMARELERRVYEEALTGALRIAGLTSVLTSNGYLRLDPNILHFSTYAAGMFLARNGRAEVKTCISGLEQYSFAYEEAFEQARWMQQVFQSSLTTPATSLVPPAHPPSSLNGTPNGTDKGPSSSLVFAVAANGSSTSLNLQNAAYPASPRSVIVDSHTVPYAVGFSH